jgi:hypothetical protein
MSAVDVTGLQLPKCYTASFAAERVESFLSIRRCPGSLLIYKDKPVFGRTDGWTDRQSVSGRDSPGRRIGDQVVRDKDVLVAYMRHYSVGRRAYTGPGSITVGGCISRGAVLDSLV